MSPKVFRESEVKGKTVIRSSGGTMGKVIELGFTLDGSAYLTVRNEQGGETDVHVKQVLGVGEYVIVRDDTANAAASATFSDVGAPHAKCKFCGYALSANTVWCPNCQRSQL